MIVLAVETSCDETSVALVDDRLRILANVVSSQMAAHAEYGGVVPEIASRHHLENLDGVLRAALEQASLPVSAIDAVAATRGPGLASSLLVGLTAAKGLSVAWDRPFLGVNHLEGHLLSPLLAEGVSAEDAFPNISLIVSGGHTLLLKALSPTQHELLGQTRDDAAGEAFDKIAKLLGLGYPGGPLIDSHARAGRADAFAFPRGLLPEDPWAFSFSGLKTSVRYFLERQPPRFRQERLADLCASAQEAVVDVLATKALRACASFGIPRLSVSGGVSCNSRLRTVLAQRAAQQGVRVFLSPPAFSTDNAAMIGAVAALRLARGECSPLSLDASPNLRLA